MIGMILFMTVRMTIGLAISCGQYALMAYVVAWAGHKGWKAGK